MNFFEQQHLARRNSRRLVLLFVLALFALIVVTNAVLAVVWRSTAGMGGLPNHFYAVNTGVILLLVLGGAWFETWNLREGGDAVAKMVGGRLATGSPKDLLDKRLINIVEEMALAAGIAVPKVYVLDHEEGINAFAAGTGPNDSVVAVTRGTLERLNRDELQGVVGHEFSHILNGDMQLNLRLTGLVFGLTLVSHLGELALRGSGRARDERGGFVFAAAVGFVLLIVGWSGTLFGRMIKAGVSREREFLADASAVQFTRNQDGIGGALRKIAGLSLQSEAGSTIRSAHAETLSHMFMAPARATFMDGWLATHPPLAQRIKRIYGSAREAMVSKPLELPIEQELPLPPIMFIPTSFAQATAAAAMAAPLSSATQTVLSPQETARRALLDACRDSYGAQAAVLAWLLANDAATQALQCAKLPGGITAAHVQALARHSELAGLEFRISTIHAAAPYLKLLDSAGRLGFLQAVDRFVAADDRVLPFEFALQTLIAARLAPPRVMPVIYQDVDQLKSAIRITLAVFAQLDQTPQMSHQNAMQSELVAQVGDLPSRDVLDYAAICNALTEIAKLAPLAKPKVIKAWASLRNGTPVAEELAQAMAAAIDCPWPVVASTH